MKPKEQVSVEKSGVIAFQDGKSEDDCPYPRQGGDKSRRVWWFNGYYSARTSKNTRGFVSVDEMLEPSDVSEQAAA